MKKTYSAGLIVFFVLIIVAGCSTVPITGRRQLSFIPPQELLTLSIQSYQDVLKTATLSSDAQQTQMVVKVGQRIAQSTETFLKNNGMANQIQNYQWEFKLVDDAKTVNAFCMPGGKIVVYTGILPITKDETGLAVVIGHEVAHAVANHGGERMSQSMVVQMGEQKLAEALKNKPEKTKQLWMEAIGAGANVGIILPFSRSQESEADHIGLVLMAQAGYDPRGAIPFWQRMNAAATSKPIELLSTHPATDRRIQDIEKEIPEALKYYTTQ
jgi:predicted Zn-dependent protease